jgi:hypothetical protein
MYTELCFSRSLCCGWGPKITNCQNTKCIIVVTYAMNYQTPWHYCHGLRNLNSTKRICNFLLSQEPGLRCHWWDVRVDKSGGAQTIENTPPSRALNLARAQEPVVSVFFPSVGGRFLRAAPTVLCFPALKTPKLQSQRHTPDTTGTVRKRRR